MIIDDNQKIMTTDTRILVSDRQLELIGMKTIASQMPIRLAGGKRLINVNGRCGACKHELPDEQVTGIITYPLPTVAVMEAVGVCHKCEVVTSYDYRFHDDLRITGLSNGSWKSWVSRRRPSFWRRIIDLLCFR